MSNKYEKILKEQTSNNLDIEEGFQEVTLKKIEWLDSNFHDIAIKITVSPEEHSDITINRIIGGNWNIEDPTSKATIWKVTNVLGTLDKVIDRDVEVENIFDTSVQPPKFSSEEIQYINESFDVVKIYGYLFKANTKSGQSSKLYWNIHDKIAVKPQREQYIIDSFNKWKNNGMVQQYWKFNTDSDTKKNFPFGENEEEQQVLESAGF